VCQLQKIDDDDDDDGKRAVCGVLKFRITRYFIVYYLQISAIAEEPRDAPKPRESHRNFPHAWVKLAAEK